MRNLRHSFKQSILVVGALLASAHIASSQALITAQRGTAITPFAQVTLVKPDWGPNSNYGYTAGLDYTRFIRSSFLQPSLEFRYTRANGSVVNERSYAGGVKLQTVATIRGFQPYATILVGHGNIDMNYPNSGYQSDNSFIFALGGGAEFNVTPCWKVRLDVSSQHWNFDPNTLTPLTVGIGVAYNLGPRYRRVQ